MKTLIAGSRNIIDYDKFLEIMDICPFKNEITEVVSGGARGVDLMGERWAKDNDILIKKFPANWEKYGKAAGFIRNREMLDYIEVAIIVWDGQSSGTKDMIFILGSKKLTYPVYQVIYDPTKLL